MDLDLRLNGLRTDFYTQASDFVHNLVVCFVRRYIRWTVCNAQKTQTRQVLPTSEPLETVPFWLTVPIMGFCARSRISHGRVASLGLSFGLGWGYALLCFWWGVEPEGVCGYRQDTPNGWLSRFSESVRLTVDWQSIGHAVD